MFTVRRPALAGQSWKISAINYFLAALVGCCIGSIGWSILQFARETTSLPGAFFSLALGTAGYLIFSLPFALLGLVPVVFLGEVMARRTAVNPAVLSVMLAVASVPVALWLMPGRPVAIWRFVGVSFGLIVTFSWVSLSFRTDGLGGILENASDA